MNPHYDGLIIGSGPLGIAAALQLAEQGLRIVVLEAGPAITDPPLSHIRNQMRIQQDADDYFSTIGPYLVPVTGDPAQNALPDAAESALLGGQGILWTNNCPRAAPFELWDAMTPDEWAQNYSRAEILLGVISDPAANSKTGRKLRDRLQEVLADTGRCVRGLPFSGRMLPSGAIHYNAPGDILDKASAEGRGRITIHPQTRASRLRHHGGHVSLVDVGEPGSDPYTLEAESVILAGGAIATPRLLHQSGIRPRALGRGFSFHALLFGQLILDESLCASGAEDDLAPRLWIPPTLAAPWHLQILRDTCPLTPTQPVGNPHRLVEFQAFLPIEFRDQNLFVLGEGGQGRFTFAFSDGDLERMRAMEADVRRLAENLGAWRRGCEPDWLPHGSAHLMGTCRMDRLGWDGVADRLGKVHGFDNLYLATIGLFPAPVAVNPTLTAMAMTLRTCDALTSH